MCSTHLFPNSRTHKFVGRECGAEACQRLHTLQASKPPVVTCSILGLSHHEQIRGPKLKQVEHTMRYEVHGKWWVFGSEGY